MADGIVLDPDLAAAQLVGQVARADQGCEAHVMADRDVAVHREQVLVPPHAGRPGGNRLTSDDALHRFVVVIDLAGTETELADMHGSRRVPAATLAAPQPPPLL